MKTLTKVTIAIATATPLLVVTSPASAQISAQAVPQGPGDTTQNSLGDGNTHRPPKHGTYDPWQPSAGYAGPQSGSNPSGGVQIDTPDTRAKPAKHKRNQTTDSTNNASSPNTRAQSPPPR